MSNYNEKKIYFAKNTVLINLYESESNIFGYIFKKAIKPRVPIGEVKSSRRIYYKLVDCYWWSIQLSWLRLCLFSPEYDLSNQTYYRACTTMNNTTNATYGVGSGSFQEQLRTPLVLVDFELLSFWLFYVALCVLLFCLFIVFLL